MISVVTAIVSVFLFAALFILVRAIKSKPLCSIIISAASPYDIAYLLATSEDTKANSVYIVTTSYDEKYMTYLKKHYLIKEVIQVVDRSN